MKISLVGWGDKPISVETFEVNVESEGHVSLRMIGVDGQVYETGLLKEEKF